MRCSTRWPRRWRSSYRAIFAGWRVLAEPPGGGLAPWQLRRIPSHVEGKIGAPPAIADLAALCGISPRHLSRLFRRIDPANNPWLAARPMDGQGQHPAQRH